MPDPAVYQVELEAGDEFTDGFDRVLLTGKETATLESVEVLGGNGYFELTGLRVAGSDRRIGSIQFSEDFPPRRPGLGDLEVGEGASLEPGRVGSLLLVGMRATKDEIGYRSGLRVSYRVGGVGYYQDHPSAVVNCPPGSDRVACDEAYDRAPAEAQAVPDQ